MRVGIPDADPTAVYRRLRDFTAYPRHAGAVRSVVHVPSSTGHPATEWETVFRGGVLRWVEEDRFHPETRSIEFRQLRGDLELFEGTWRVEQEPGGRLLVAFGCLFDLGIPTLDEVLDPIAEEALYENVAAILEGLFGPGTEVLEAVGSPAARAAEAVIR
jgi:hypothetical protein